MVPPSRLITVPIAQADRIAARHWQMRLAAAGEQGAEQQDRGAHGRDEIPVDARRLDAVGSNGHGQACLD